MHRKIGQRNLVDEMVGEKGGNRQLDRIGDLIDWRALGGVVGSIYASSRGRPAYPPLVLVKALLLAQWYGLSDPQLEEALGDRLSFRRFIGLSLEEDTPDHVTLWRFRQKLSEQGVDQALVEEVNRQLESRGLILKRGTLMDATLVKAQAAKPPMPSQGKTPKEPVDPDANWTRQYGQNHYGYKAHLGVDEGSGLVRRAILTPAKLYESQVADDLICGDEGAVYGDRAYEHKERRRRLKSRGIKDRIMHRSHKNQPALPPWQRKRNALIRPIRARVERVFGTLKRSYGYTKVRYFSLAANTTQLCLLTIALNLRRAVVLTT